MLEWLKKHHIDKAAKQLLEKNIDPIVATWESLRDGAVLKEHFRDAAKGLKRE